MSDTNDRVYPVMENIHDKANELLEAYTQKHSKTFAVRFDLLYPVDYGNAPNNDHISDTIAKAEQTFRRRGLDPAHIWVREQKSSHHQHYHGVMLLDGQKTHTKGYVHDTMERHWKKTIGSESEGLIDYCNGTKDKPHENGIMIQRSQGIPAAVQRQISYICKAEDKAPPKDGLRDFGTSNPKRFRKKTTA